MSIPAKIWLLVNISIFFWILKLKCYLGSDVKKSGFLIDQHPRKVL